MPKKKPTSKGSLGEANSLDKVPRAFLPQQSDEDLDAKQAGMSTKRKKGGPPLDDDDDPAEENLTARGFFDRGVPPTELEDPS